MEARHKFGLAGVVGAGVAAVLLIVATRREESHEAVQPVGAASAARVVAPAELVDTPAPAEPRAAAEVAAPDIAPDASAPPSKAPAPRRTDLLRGLVLDLDGAPVAGVALVVEGSANSPMHGVVFRSDEEVRTDAAGAFEIKSVGRRSKVVVADERYVVVLEPVMWFEYASIDAQLIVVARKIELAGFVAGEHGRLLQGARVSVDPVEEVRSRIDRVLEGTVLAQRNTETDEQGRFELDAPAIEGAKLRTSAPGYEDDVRPVPAATALDLVIALRPLQDGSRLLEGTVVDPGGKPVAGANVILDQASGTTDAAGKFALRVAGPGTRGVLLAVAKDRLPARVERRGSSNLDPNAWPDPLVLVFGGEPLSISGRVVDAEGKPQWAATVAIDDLTPFGAVEAGDVPGQVFVFAETLVMGERFGGPTANTDAKGSFALRGLLQRDYRLSVRVSTSLVALTTGPIPAGTQGLEIRLPADDLYPRVAGRVVSPKGDPIKASVRLGRQMDVGPDLIRGRGRATDADGRFEFKDVSRHVSHISVVDAVSDAELEIPLPPGDVEDLEIVLARRCRFRIELADRGLAQAFSILDREGNVLDLTVLHGNVTWDEQRSKLTDGRSETLSVSELAQTLVLYDGDAEVQRRSIELVPGEVTTIGP